MAKLPFELIEQIYKLSKNQETKRSLKLVDTGIKKREFLQKKRLAKYAVTSWVDNPQENPSAGFVAYTKTIQEANEIAGDIMVDYPEDCGYYGPDNFVNDLRYKRGFSIPKVTLNYLPYGEPVLAYKYDDLVSGVFKPFPGIENEWEMGNAIYNPEALWASKTKFPIYGLSPGENILTYTNQKTGEIGSILG